MFRNLFARFHPLLIGQEEKVGSPEKPLSDLGAAAYRSYWASVIIQAVQSFVVSKYVSKGGRLDMTASLH